MSNLKNMVSLTKQNPDLLATEIGIRSGGWFDFALDSGHLWTKKAPSGSVESKELIQNAYFDPFS